VAFYWWVGPIEPGASLGPKAASGAMITRVFLSDALVQAASAIALAIRVSDWGQ